MKINLPYRTSNSTQMCSNVISNATTINVRLRHFAAISSLRQQRFTPVLTKLPQLLDDFVPSQIPHGG